MLLWPLRTAARGKPIRVGFVYLLLTLFFAHVYGLAIVKPGTDNFGAKELFSTVHSRAEPDLSQVPSLETLRDAVKKQTKAIIAESNNPGAESLTAVFYTNNPLDISELECWAKQVIGENKYIYFENALTEEDAEKFQRKLYGNKEALDFYQKRLSRVIAELAEGDTMLLIPDGSEPKDRSTWTLYEFPAIQHINKNEVEVYRLDPQGGLDGAEMIWEKGNTPNLPEPLDTLPPDVES